MDPIIRAGPWGTVGSPYASAGTSGTYPVNCARSGWPGQSWEAHWVRSRQPALGDPPTSGTMGLGSTIDVLRATALITINFCYQATEPTYIYVNGSFGTASEGADTSLAWSVETTEGGTTSGGDSPSLGSSFGSAYNLPATVFGRFRFSVSATTPTQAVTGKPRQQVQLYVTVS